MDVFELVKRDESHPVYAQLEAENMLRLELFLRSIIAAAIQLHRPLISTSLINCLHVHAVAGLHTHMGEYRPFEVSVGNHKSELAGGHLPSFYRVKNLMDDFVNQINRQWDQANTLALCAYVLWRVNFIHPFINGNGRTARSLCYFVLCVKNRGFIDSSKTLSTLIKENRDGYLSALRECDQTYIQGGEDLSPMVEYLASLVREMLPKS